jgi:hypothetical protein
LTAALPDVAKGGVRQGGVIRDWMKGGAALLARDLL